jgi:apolipoprotein N-acyltransferase
MPPRESHQPRQKSVLNLFEKTFTRFVAAALSGLLLVTCLPKIHLPGVVWVACLPLLAILAGEKRLKQAFLLGYVCGAVFFAGSCYWFVIVMEFYGHLAPTLAVLVLVLFVIIDSTFFGGFGLAMGWAARRSPGWALALSPFLWMAMELSRTYLITGFPWNLLGYAVQAPGVRQIASVTGVYGLSFLAVATSALLARVWDSSALLAWLWDSSRLLKGKAKLEIRNSKLENRRQAPGTLKQSSTGSRYFDISARPSAVLALAGWVVVLLLAQWKLAPPPAVTGKELAVLVQPNVPLDDAELDRWAPWKDPTQLQRLVEFSVSAVKQSLPDTPIENRQSKIDNPPLLVWAENPAPFFFTRDPVFRNAMENMARQTHAIVIVNTIVPVDAEGELITNTGITLDPEGREVSRYDKIHLVPFGEYVPWWALPGLVHKITSEVGNFIPGSSYPVAKFPGGGIGVFICYEAIIPQLARHLVANGAGVLVNISNDAWYGDSAAAYQHLEMARLRAIENHRYLLRATNNGLTTLIDPYGRVLEEIPRYQRMVMAARFDYETRQTFYSSHGDVFAWACAAVAAVMLVLGTRNRKPEARS